MATKKYIFTADAKQMEKELSSVSKILNTISNQPETFQKSLYNALSKAQRDIKSADGDISKLGKSLNVLVQSINKGLDFTNMKDATKGIVTMFRDVQSSALQASEKVTKLTNEIKSVSSKSFNLGNSFDTFIEKTNKSINSTKNLKNNVLLANDVLSKISNSAITASKKTDSLNNSFVEMKNNSNSLSSQLSNIVNKINGLSTSSESAKINIQIIRNLMSELSTISSKVREFKFETKNINDYKNKLESLKKTYSENLDSIKANDKAIKQLNKEYNNNKKSLDTLINRYNNLKSEIDRIKSAGGVIPNETVSQMENLANAVKKAEINLKSKSDAISVLNNSQSKLKASTKMLANEMTRLEKTKGISDRQIDALNRMSASLEKQLKLSTEIANTSKNNNLASSNQRLLELNKQIQTLSPKSVTLNTSFDSFIESSNRAIQSSKALKESILSSSGAINRMTSSALSMAGKTNGLNASFQNMEETSATLSSRLNSVSEVIANLSPKAKDAKINLEKIRNAMRELSDVSGRVKEFSLGIKDVDSYSAKIQKLKEAFSANSKEMKNNESVIQSLTSEYSKSEKSLNALITRYNNLKKEMASIKSSGGVIPVSTSQQMEQLSATVKKAESNLKQQANTINVLTSNQNKLKTSTQLLASEIARLETAKGINEKQINLLRNYNSELQKSLTATTQAANAAKLHNTELTRQSSTLRLVGGQFRSLIYDLNAVRIAFIILSSATGIGAAVKVIGDFDRSMARVKSLMLGAGEATGSLNVKYQALSDTVMALGASTKFTAGQVAEGAVIITQAGYSANQTIAALKPTLDLAVAGQIEMKEAADTLTKTISMFNKTAEDAANIADVYAAAVNYSQTNMTELATAMSYVGPVAQSVGLSLEQTAAYLAVLANNGITASKAGTSLRQMLMNLKNPTADANKIINTYGVNLKKLEEQGLSTEEAIRKALVTLGENDQLSRVIRVTALPSAEILAKSNTQLENMATNLQKIDGYASKVAENNMDNLLDQFVQFASALQDTIIRFGQFTGLTDGLTSGLKSTADAIRSWNTDMPNLITNALSFGATILVLKNRMNSYRQSIEDNKKAIEDNKKATKTIGFGSMISSTKEASKSMLSMSVVTERVKSGLNNLKTTVKGVATSILSLGKAFAVVSIQTAAISAVFYGIFQIVEKVISSNRSMEDVLNRNSDLFQAASESAAKYKEALDAISASAKNMAPAVLTANIEQSEEDIETTRKNTEKAIDSLIDKFKEAQSSVSLMSLYGMIEQEDYDIIMEQFDNDIDLLKGMKEGIENGEDVADIFANIDTNAVKKIQDMLNKKYGSKRDYAFISDVDLLQDLKYIAENLFKINVEGDKLNALETENSRREIKALRVDISGLISDLKNASTINTVGDKLFEPYLLETSKQIREIDKIIPVDEFQNAFKELLKSEGGDRFAELIDFSRFKGGFYFIEDINEEIDILNERMLNLGSSTENTSQKFNLFAQNATDLGNATSNIKLFDEAYGSVKGTAVKEEAKQLQELIDRLKAFQNTLQEVNETSLRLNFYKVLNEQAKKIDTNNIKKATEELFKVSELSDSFKDSFLSSIKPEFLYEGLRIGALKPDSIILDTDIDKIRIAGQTIDSYVASLQKMAQQQYDTRKITKEQYDELIAFSKLFKGSVLAGLAGAGGKKRRRDDDLELMYYKAEMSIGKTTNGLYAQWEALVKVREIERQILDITERNKDSKNKYYGLLLKSLEVEKEIARAQYTANVPYEPMKKEATDTQKIFSAGGVDTNIVEIGKEYIQILTERKALENAINDTTLKNKEDVIANLENELRLNERIYQLKLDTIKANMEMSLSNSKQEYIDLTSASLFAEREKYQLKENALKAQTLIYNNQILEIEKKINEYRQMLETSDPNNAYYQSQLQLLEVKKEQLMYEKQIAEMQTKTQNPMGWQGFTNAMREYSQSIANDAELVKEAFTSTFQSIESGLTEGLYAAMKKTEYDWSQFWDNIAKIFLEKAIQMTIMKGLTNIMDMFSVLFTGGNAGGTTWLGGLLSGALGGGSSGSRSFTQPSILHATGGIVKKPTLMLGKDGVHKAGEAGAEAILPVKRMSNGKMGVSVDGSGGSIVNNNDFSVNITTTGSSGNKQQDDEYINNLSSKIEIMMNKQINEYMTKQRRQGGMFYRMAK